MINYLIQLRTSWTNSIILKFSSQHVQKMLEFIYTGITTISEKEEDSFSNLLMDLEIGGVKPNICASTAFSIAERIEEDVMLVEVDKSPDAAEGLRNLKCEICGQVLKTRTGLRM